MVVGYDDVAGIAAAREGSRACDPIRIRVASGRATNHRPRADLIGQHGVADGHVAASPSVSRSPGDRSVAGATLLCAPNAVRAADKLSLYAYSDTRALVALVEEAAGLVERDGERAFQQFAVKGSKWLNGDVYFFAYLVDGTCVFHPLTPELVGKNVLDLRDLNGKPIIQSIVDIGKKPGANASGWVFYLWENQIQLTPMWKSTYVRKVAAPDGKTYVIGSGLYHIKMERLFIEERVRR
jgi:Cache domain